MTTVRRKAKARRKRAPAVSALTVSADGEEAGAAIYRLTMPGRVSEYWLRTRGASGEQLVAAGIDGIDVPVIFDALELNELRPLAMELARVARMKPGGRMREAIARTAWTACSCLHLALIWDRGVQRQYHRKKRQTADAAKALHAAAAARIEAARLEYMGSRELQAMKVADAAEALRERWALGFDTVRKKVITWRRAAGIASRK